MSTDTDTDTDTVVHLTGWGDVKLRVPRSYAEMADVLEQQGRGANGNRFMAALIAICWPKQNQISKRIDGYDYDVMAMGGAAYDSLRRKGAKAQEIAQAGLVAARIVSDAFIGEEDVQAAEDFSDAPALTSTESHA